jgi:hypothetical protein
MNKLMQKPNAAQEEKEPEQKGPNLILLYALLALALMTAIALAVTIVWPFYLRR